MKIEEKFVETKFGKICYLEIGEGKETAVYIHGWFGHPAPAFMIHSVLESKSFRVIAPYLPGHGKSFSVQPNFKFETLKEIMEDFYEKLGLNQTYTIGHSVGASLTWEIALQNDGKIKKALISDGFSNPFGKGKLGLLKTFLEDEAIWDLVKEFLQNKLQRNNDNFKVDYFQRSAFKSFNILKSLIVSRRTSQTPPLMFLWGSSDDVCPMEDFIYSSGINEKEIITFDGGHYWYINHLNELKDYIAEFAT